MVTRTNRIIERKQKQDRVINLTDIGRHNTMHARLVRDLQDDGTYRLREVNWDGSLIPEENLQDPNRLDPAEGTQTSLPIIVAQEDKGSGYEEPYQPSEIEHGYEEHLENTGATVHSSITYYPASGVTTNKRTMTAEERRNESGYY